MAKLVAGQPVATMQWVGGKVAGHASVVPMKTEFNLDNLFAPGGELHRGGKLVAVWDGENFVSVR